MDIDLGNRKVYCAMKAAGRESGHHLRKLINTNHQEKMGSLAIQCKQREICLSLQ